MSTRWFSHRGADSRGLMAANNCNIALYTALSLSVSVRDGVRKAVHAPLYVAIITTGTACPLPTPHPSLLPRSPSLPLCPAMDGLSAVHHPVVGTRQSRLVPKDFTPFCLQATAGTWGVNDDVRDTPARKFQEWLPSDRRREKVL